MAAHGRRAVQVCENVACTAAGSIRETCLLRPVKDWRQRPLWVESGPGPRQRTDQSCPEPRSKSRSARPFVVDPRRHVMLPASRVCEGSDVAQFEVNGLQIEAESFGEDSRPAVLLVMGLGGGARRTAVATSW